MITALVLGSNGQDGVLLSRRLLARGYEVVGVGRQRESRLRRVPGAFRYRQLDLERDLGGLTQLLAELRPARVFHVAAVHGSAERSRYEPVFAQMLAVNVASLHVVLEYLRLQNPDARALYASSAKVFGPVLPARIDEQTARVSDCLYAVTKNAAGDAIRHYRREHGCQASQLFLFNHESEYRQRDFFIPKLVRVVARAVLGLPVREHFASLAFHCDWGVAEEFMDIAVDCLERAPGEDFVLATGRCVSASALIAQLFAARGLATPAPVGGGTSQRGQQPYTVCMDRLAARVGRTPVLRIEALLDRLIEAEVARLRARTEAELEAP